MITLPNGDRWIIDDKELCLSPEAIYPAAIPPDTSVKDFVEGLYQGHCLPRKLTEGNYWDANFDPYKEVLGQVAIKTLHNKWSDVYVMPWGVLYVVCVTSDGYDACVGMEQFESIEAYHQSVCFKTN